MKKINIYVNEIDDSLYPIYMSENAAGADVKANITDPVILIPKKSIAIPTGLKLEIPVGFEIQIRPRSGLALNNQVTVLNSPGTIDADFRGEIKIILINHSEKAFTIEPKMRIAQLVLSPVYQINFIKQKTLTSTIRAEKGFGHSGLF